MGTDIGHDGKENVLIFLHSLQKNGITTAALNLMRALDTNKRNYYLSCPAGVLSEHEDSPIPEGITLFPQELSIRYSLIEAAALFCSFKLNMASKPVESILKKLYQRESMRIFGTMRFSAVIHFEGYGKNIIRLLQEIPAHRIIFVHNHMVKEAAAKSNAHRPTLTLAYREYDRIAPVFESLIPPLLELGAPPQKIQVVNNLHDPETVRRRADEPIRFGENTCSSVSLSELQTVLDGDGLKFISIGRFSAEKGHDMLITAFEMFHRSHPDTHLILIGGYGPLYEQTLDLCQRSPARNHIFLIQMLDNPMPVLRKCNLFILSSRYEGLAVTLHEADSLNLPILSTDIPGPGDFIRQNGGTPYPISPDGLLSGMEDYIQGKILPLGIDYECYNSRALAQFESLFA